MVKSPPAFTWPFSLSKSTRISAVEMAFFLRQFATLMAAGIPLIQSCEVLEKSQEKFPLRQLIHAIKRDILTGKNLYQSLRAQTKYFDELTCQLVYLGEQTGKLDTLLLAIANQHEKKAAFTRQLKQALFYPCLVAVMTLLFTLCLFLFVIPRFAELFKDVPEKLPLLTRWIFSLSTQLQSYAPICIVSLVLLGLVAAYTPLGAAMKPCLKAALLKLPFIQHHQRQVILMHFARSLALTCSAGIPITEALHLSAKACNNPSFSSLIASLRSKMSTGLQLHTAMQAFSYFPHLMIQLIKTGEESGMLESMLTHLAQFFETDTEQRLAKVNTLLEPLIMLVQGVLIGGLVIAMYLPLFKLGTVL